MTREEMDFIGSMNMCDEISNEAYQKIMVHCEEQEPCEDCIGREETMQIIRAWFDRDAKPSELLNEIEQMPSVTPQPITLEKAIDYLHEIGWMQEHDKEMAQLNRKIKQEPKVGEWLKNGDFCKCSNCHGNVLFSNKKYYNYCYHCGAKMV